MTLAKDRCGCIGENGPVFLSQVVNLIGLAIDCDAAVHLGIAMTTATSAEVFDRALAHGWYRRNRGRALARELTAGQ